MTQLLLRILTYLGRKIYHKISQLLFRDAYEISDKDYWDWDRESFNPSKSLNSHLLFSLYLPYKKHHQNNECNLIIVKTKNKEVLFKTNLTVIAYSNFCTYQESLTLYHVNDTPTIVKLPNIPLRAIEFKNNRIVTSYEKLKIKAEEMYITIDDPINIANQHNEYTGHFMCTDILNDDFVKKWEKYYNINIIEEWKNELRSYYHFHLAYRPCILFKSLLDKVRRFFTHPIYLFLSTNCLLTLSFWTKNILIARSLRKYIQKKNNWN